MRVVLRDFAADLPPPGTPVSADTLWDFIVKQLPEQLKPYADELQAELLEKSGLILLDGLDEVPDARQRRQQIKLAVQDRERALAGDLLARLGDTRQHLLDVEHLRFSVVPGGPFWMGDASDANAPMHRNTGLDY